MPRGRALVAGGSRLRQHGHLNVSANMQLAAALNGTGVVTNYGTITVGGNFDMGVYGGTVKTQKGTAARVDNFGTINIGLRFRMSGAGTPSVFHNHPGATFNKTGGGRADASGDIHLGDRAVPLSDRRA